jgi:hypothetical protein
MRFKPYKREGKIVSLTLEPRSAYLMRGAARWKYQHSIPASQALRYSITFRTLRKSRARMSSSLMLWLHSRLRASFHSNHEHDGGRTIRQIDPEAVGLTRRQVARAHVEDPLLAGHIPTEGSVWDICRAALVNIVNRASNRTQHRQRAGCSRENRSRVRDRHARRVAHPKLHGNRAAALTWVDAASVAVDRRQNHTPSTNRRAAHAERNGIVYCCVRVVVVASYVCEGPGVRHVVPGVGVRRACEV